jgi:hypothetical protein
VDDDAINEINAELRAIQLQAATLYARRQALLVRLHAQRLRLVRHQPLIVFHPLAFPYSQN